jgi:hypothetical protein
MSLRPPACRSNEPASVWRWGKGVEPVFDPADAYRHAHPVAKDVALLVKVSDSTILGAELSFAELF